MAMECWREALSRGVSYRSRDVVGARRGNQAAVLPDLQFIDQPGPLNLGEGTLVRDGIVLGGRIGGGRQLHGFTPRAVGFSGGRREPCDIPLSIISAASFSEAKTCDKSFDGSRNWHAECQGYVA